MVGIVQSIVDFMNERRVWWEGIAEDASAGEWVVVVSVVMTVIMVAKDDVGRRDYAIKGEAHEIPGVGFVEIGGVVVEELAVLFGSGDDVGFGRGR